MWGEIKTKNKGQETNSCGMIGKMYIITSSYHDVRTSLHAVAQQEIE